MATKNKSTKVLRGDSPMLFIYSTQRASTDADVNTSMLFSVSQWLKCRPDGTIVAKLKYRPDGISLKNLRYRQDGTVAAKL